LHLSFQLAALLGVLLIAVDRRQEAQREGVVEDADGQEVVAVAD